MGAHSAATRRGHVLTHAGRGRGVALLLLATVASALLVALYARGAWALGFVALLPWLLALDRDMSVARTLAAALAMSAAFVLAAFGWFAPAISAYTGTSTTAAFALLMAASPVLQPQILAYAIARRLAHRYAPALRAALAIAAWLAVEWVVPRLFGDTFGHGVYPARQLRQLADLGGAGLLTLLLLAVNEALAIALRSRGRDAMAPVAVALALPLLVAGYGAWRIASLHAEAAGPRLRVGLVQASIVDYEQRRREHGAYAVVRDVLDTHFALSTDAVAEQGVDALIWPETVYPTTFRQPRSAGGAALDAELVAFTARAGVPLVFGTYERDADGEYNVAAFVDPLRGPLGAYRKTRLFPLTEYVPPALDTPALRRALPWSGTWRPGDGARVFPLRSGDDEIPVVPLICRDDVDPRLAIDGARLGARLIVGLSNDAWFTDHPRGAELHLVVAAFRSIETRLPQVRATTNGISAVIDDTGDVVARSRMGERTVLTGDVQLREHAAPPVVRMGTWPGPLALPALAAFVVSRWLGIFRRKRRPSTPTNDTPVVHRALLLGTPQRLAVGALRACSRIGVLALGAVALARLDNPAGMLAQLRQFAWVVLVPELAAFVVAWFAVARVHVDGGALVMDTRRRRIEIPLRSLVGARLWRLPWPRPGMRPVLASGGAWPQAIATDGAVALAGAITPVIDPPLGPRSLQWQRALALPGWRIDHPLIKFVLFPLVPALPAFRLHQHIAYGGTFGEYYTFGLQAYLGALLLWWASWAVSLVLIAGGLRAIAEILSAAVVVLRPVAAVGARRGLLGVARILYFIGVPLWLLSRLLGG